MDANGSTASPALGTGVPRRRVPQPLGWVLIGKVFAVGRAEPSAAGRLPCQALCPLVTSVLGVRAGKVREQVCAAEDKREDVDWAQLNRNVTKSTDLVKLVPWLSRPKLSPMGGAC